MAIPADFHYLKCPSRCPINVLFVSRLVSTAACPDAKRTGIALSQC